MHMHGCLNTSSLNMRHLNLFPLNTQLVLQSQRMDLLTHNAIMLLSAGFQQPINLQVFSLKKKTDTEHKTHMCLTDGVIYIGAKFHAQEANDLQNYWIVKVTASYIDRTQPITIKTLSVVSTTPIKLLGNPPITLNEYFVKQTQKPLEDTTIRKKQKMEATFSIGSKKSASGNSQKPQKKSKRLKLANQSGAESSQKQKNNSQQDGNRPKEDLSASTGISGGVVHGYHSPPKQLVKNSLIRDLFARSTAWVILCRVDHLNFVECKKGFAVNFALSDETGDYIKCVYFDSRKQRAREVLEVKKYYLFSGGQIKSQKDQLKITFDCNSDIILQQNQDFKINQKKFTRIDKIADYRHQQQVSVIGVVKKIKMREETSTRKIKTTGTICDPLHSVEVDFMIYIPFGDPEIKAGQIVILNKFNVYNQNNIFRLNSQFGSYFTDVDGDNSLAHQFKKVMQTKDYSHDHYKNISMFAFTQRTFNQLRNILGQTDDDKVFSSLDCWILEINKKKSYYACKTCKKLTQKKQMGLFHCTSCRKTVDTILTYTLSLNFSDYTGNCSIDVIGQHAQKLLEMKAHDYNNLSIQEQSNHLEMLKFNNITLRLRTQKKQQKKCAHSVYGIDKPNPQNSVKEIRKKLLMSKLKMQEHW